MRKREKRLSHFFIKKFILFIVFLLIGITVLMNLVLHHNSFYNETISNLFAENLIQPDYESIDTSVLEDLDGWIEILDSQNNVIYTKGQVGEIKHSYTQIELLEQASFKQINKPQGITLAGLIQINVVDQNEAASYLASYASFERNGEEYLGIVKIPANKINTNYTLIGPKGEVSKALIQNISFLLIGMLLITMTCIYYYSKSIQKHLAKPNKALVEGLEAVTLGDYSTQLQFEAEYEYKEIQQSFNYLTLRLQQAEIQRAQYEKEREQLFANLTHDLKTPITTIQGYSRALLDDVVSDENKKKNYIKTIYDKTHHLTELINRLLTYTKLNQSEYELKFKLIDYSEFIRRIVAESFDEIEQHHQKIELNIPNRPIYIMIDETEMRRVLHNLISNAIKHNPSNTTIIITLNTEHHQVKLDIADNGTPIKTELQSRLFEPFVCGDESRHTKNGSGLGLSICQKIIQKHEGELTFIQINDHLKIFQINLKEATS